MPMPSPNGYVAASCAAEALRPCSHRRLVSFLLTDELRHAKRLFKRLARGVHRLWISDHVQNKRRCPEKCVLRHVEKGIELPVQADCFCRTLRLGKATIL
eukprot:1877152-Pleurochrysis_carterae.AAC.7